MQGYCTLESLQGLIFRLEILQSKSCQPKLLILRQHTGCPRAKWLFNWALRERNIQVRLYLKVVLKFWDVDILIIKTNFQKINIGWPQQPPTEKGHILEDDIL